MIVCGDALELLKKEPDGWIDCCVTSPPYWGLRDYKIDGQLGSEQTPEEYIERLTNIFREVRRVIRGCLWLNLGDTYANDAKWGGTTGGKHVKALHCQPIGRLKTRTGLKPKELVGIPWLAAFALQSDGWWLRQDIIWHKPNPMPEPVIDRCTKAHEYLFLLTKTEKYYWDRDAMQEPASGRDPMNKKHRGKHEYEAGDKHHRTKVGLTEVGPRDTRNRRTVWTIGYDKSVCAHTAVFPVALVEPCILSSCPPDGIVLDPFCGSGTTGIAANRHNRMFLGYDINPEYCEIASRRIEENKK